MALFFRLCTTPHSILNSFNTEPNPKISDSNAVTYKALFGYKDLNDIIEKIILQYVLSSFDPGVSDAAYGLQIPLPFNWSSSSWVMKDKGFRIQIAIMNYYRFVVLHEEEYRYDQEYPAALNALHGAVHEMLSSFLQLRNSEFEKRHIISLVTTRLFSDLPIPPKWSDLDDIRKKALPLTTGSSSKPHTGVYMRRGSHHRFISSLLAPVLTQEISPSENSHHYIVPAVMMADIRIRSNLPEAFKFLRTNDLLFQAAYRGVYEAWFSPLFISSLLAPVLTQEISPSEDSHHYILPAVVMADIGIRSGLPEAFKFLRTNDLLNNLFPYHRNRPIYSLLARYIAVVCTTYTTVMESHEDTANGTWNQELSENQLLLSTVGSLAQVTILVLAEQEPEMYKVLLRDVWSGDSDALSKEALRDVEVLVTNMIRPESEYWNGLKILDEDISLLRGLREDEHLQLQEELSTRWLTFKDDLDRAQGQDTAGGIEQSSTGMRSDGR
ncbi:hypothetical protein BDZ89DRAFT_569580 [Hymenopellis radicata]|nr:hypothetical protein BDZ89DRAFT_569580 [Hymenopellis radicata]